MIILKISFCLDISLYQMAQSIVKLKYSEVNVGEEQAELTSKNNAKNNRSYTQ